MDAFQPKPKQIYLFLEENNKINDFGMPTLKN